MEYLKFYGQKPIDVVFGSSQIQRGLNSFKTQKLNSINLLANLFLVLSITKNKMCLQIHVDTLFFFFAWSGEF